MTTDPPTAVRIASDMGRIEVFAAAGSPFRVEGRAVVTTDGGLTTVRGSGRLAVFVDAGTDLTIGTSVGRIVVKGPVGHVAASTDTGRIQIEQAASVDIRCATGRVEVGEVTGTCRVRSNSGRVEVGSCCDADIAGHSGRIEVRAVNGRVEAHSVSGRIEVEMAAANDVVAETVSGRIDVSLPAGTVAHQPVDGASDGRPPECDCTVVARSTNGKVVVTAR
ncbi:MAG TPA: DUF4097 family beta strand repeat-containing protein [Ilumatobacter sp.]